MAHKEAYKTFDRGTAAGRMLYNLYNKKSMDSTLDPDLLARLQKMRAEREQAESMMTKDKAVPKSRAHVNVPKFGRRSSSAATGDRAPPMPYGGRRKQDTIQREVRQQPVEQPPQPSRPCITEGDKERLRQIMEYGQALPAPSNMPAPAPRRAPTLRELKLDRFEELAEEIAERKEFLADLREGDLSKTKAPAERQAMERRVVVEIQDRVTEMKTIDQWLKDRPPTP
jgi:hypothetical protein